MVQLRCFRHFGRAQVRSELRSIESHIRDKIQKRMSLVSNKKIEEKGKLTAKGRN